MRFGLVLVMLAIAACGSTEQPPAELVVVAHQDDDMLFMQPDLFDVVHAHHPVEVVYVTAGDGGNGIEFSEHRYHASRFAYGEVAGSQRWICDRTLITAHTVDRCWLEDRPVTLIFLGYPDGGIGGSVPQSLLHLWQGQVSLGETIAQVPTTYSRDELIDTVAAIITQVRPQTIRTLELSAAHGYDHSDHMMVGTLTQLALAQSGLPAELIAYRGYNVNMEPANLTDEEYARSSLFMRSYGACTLGCGACDAKPCDKIDDGWYDGFMHRHYAIGMQNDTSGVLGSSAGCIGFATTDDATLVNCDRAPDVSIDDAGLMRSAADDQCLEVEGDGTLGLGVCDPDPTRFFQLDDEGHLWAGGVTAGQPMLFDHTTCVYADGGKIVVGVCGADRDWRWTLRP